MENLSSWEGKSFSKGKKAHSEKQTWKEICIAYDIDNN